MLLLGKRGRVGWELQRSLAPLGELIALDRDSIDLCGDFSRPDRVAQTVARVRPDIVVNAVAYTSVDKAESEPDVARQANAVAPGVVAQAAHEVGAWFVHYSTDYVFDGSGTVPWQETDATAPLSVYGRTKLAGEQLIAQHCPRHLILRTSWIHAARGSNFARTILALARERDELKVISDQIGAPTGADLIADVTAHVVRGATRGVGGPGIYHLCAAGETSWHGYAEFLVDHARQMGATLAADLPRVVPVPASAFPTPAVRPCNSRLDTSKLRGTFHLELPDWKLGVARLLAEMT